MNKNKKIIFTLVPLTLSIGALIAIGAIGPLSISTRADIDYKLTFNSKNNFNPNITKTAPDYTDSALKYADTIGQYEHLKVKTVGGYDKLDFFFEGAFANPDGYVTLGYDGGFGNTWLNQTENNGQINGLKSIKVTYTGNPLTVNYGYEPEMREHSYHVYSQPIVSGQEYNFDNSYPEYFSINTAYTGLTYIQDVVLTYTCNPLDRHVPTAPYYQYGYNQGIFTVEPLQLTAKSLAEARHQLDEAAMKHYTFVDILFDFDVGNEDYYNFLYNRRNLSHVIPYATTELKSNAVNTFLLVYYGDSHANNDAFFDGSVDQNELGLENSLYTASMYTPVTEKNRHTQFINANSELRRKYIKDHNLGRPADYNSFAIDQLPDTQLVDVCNSEELWWTVANGYKPQFPLENSKAEWIYNQARDVVRSIIIDDMDNLEKARAIYEWIIDNTAYDNDALNSSRQGAENTCYYLEGVFERHLAVCDGFSKAFVLMGKIEGLDVLRGSGFADKEGGHAWNYFREDPSQEYHLICPTWGQRDLNILKDNPVDENDTYRIDTSVYSAFMMPSTYFYDLAGINFIDYENADKPLAKTQYSKDIYALDTLMDQPQYDFHINSKEEFIAVLNTIKSNFPKQSLSFSMLIDDAVLPLYNECLTEAGFTDDVYRLGNLQYNSKKGEYRKTYGKYIIETYAEYRG